MIEVTQKLKAKPSGNLAVNLEEAPSQQSHNHDIYSGLFKHMNEGIVCCKVIFDDTGKPIDYVVEGANRAFKRIMKAADKPLLGRKASDLMSNPSNPKDWKEKCDKAVQTHRSFTVEKYSPMIKRWLAFYAYCPKEGYLAITVRDITARKLTEQALRQSEKQYKQLAGSIADPFFALDSSLKIVYWNRASEKLTKTAASWVLGKHFFEVFGKDKTVKKAVKLYLNVMRTKKPKTFVGELPKCDADKVFEIQVYPTGNGISVFAKDATERKKIQTSMEAYTQQLEELVKERTEKLKGVERLAAIGETAGMVGHDIRNPLQAIIGELYLAKGELEEMAEGNAKASLLDSLCVIEEQTLYINKIVTDLQDYAKPLTPNLEIIDLEKTIEMVLQTIEIPDSIDVSYCVNKPFSTFSSDPSFLKRILTNLVRNGVQAMQEKGGSLSINAFQREKSVIIAISDTGVGIAEGVRDKIFKPLFTTKSKGQGFGLAVVKKLVEALGGQVSFESKVDRGTTFILELPVNPVAALA